MTWAPVVVAGIDTSRAQRGTIKVGQHLQIVSSVEASMCRTRENELSCWLVGSALLGSRVLLSGEDLANAVQTAGGVREFIAPWGRDAKNPCASIIADYRGEAVYVLPDPLGGCIVFFYEQAGATFVSPDLESLVEVAASYGLRPKKNLDYQLERTVLGNGGLTPASYTGVGALSSFDYAVVNKDGIGIFTLPSKENYLNPATSYVDVMDAYKDDILDSVGAITKVEEKKIAHLTGGFDSRLVLSAIMEAGSEDQFSFFCSGPVGTADRDTADGLAAALGLTRTLDPGLSSNAPATVEDRFLAPMLNSAGITGSGPLGGEVFTGKVLVGGGYGGLLRSVYSKLIPEPVDQMPPENLAEKLWGLPALALGGLVTSSSRDGILDRLSQAFGKLTHEGYEDDYLGDAFYLTQRNRYHFGQNSLLWSRVGRRYDPLYSIQGPRLARMLPIKSRNTNVAGFDIMASMRADLLGYPFDSDRFVGEYSTLRRIPVVKDFLGTAPKFEPRSVEVSSSSQQTVDANLRAKHIAQSRKMKVNFWQIEAMAATQNGLKKLLQELDVSDFGKAVNPDYVSSLAMKELRTRAQVRHLYAVYSMLLWYTQP